MSRRFPNGTTIIIVHPGPPDLSDSTGLTVNTKARLMGGEIGILEPGVRFIESPYIDEPLFPQCPLETRAYTSRSSAERPWRKAEALVTVKGIFI